MKSRVVVSLIGAAVLIAAAVAVQPAVADTNPPGCTVTVQTPYVSSGVIHGSSSASCNTSASRTLYAELWHDFGILPPAKVVQSGDHGTKTSYHPTYAVCDNGGTTTYATKGYFGGGYTGYIWSSEVTVSHC